MNFWVSIGAYELTNAVRGEDLASGRELGTGERWFRGLLAPLDIVPGLGAAKKFATTGRVTSKVADFSKIGLKSADLAKVRQSIGNTIQTARAKGLERISQLKEAGKATAIAAGKKIEKDVIDVGKVIDKGITAGKQAKSNLSPQHVTPEGVLMREGVENTHAAENIFRGQMENVKGVFGSGGAQGAGKVHRSEIDEVIKKNYDKDGNLINRSVVPKGYDNVEDFLKLVDDTTIKEFGYDSVEEFKSVIGHVDDYLNASPKNNIVNKGLAGGEHVKGVDYDVLGFPIFKGDNLLFSLKLDKEYYVMKDTNQFKECTKMLKQAVEKGEVPKELFTPQQLDQIEKGRARIKGLTWHHHQVPGKMQLVSEDIHGAVSHLGGNKLWGEGIR